MPKTNDTKEKLRKQREKWRRARGRPGHCVCVSNANTWQCSEIRKEREGEVKVELLKVKIHLCLSNTCFVLPLPQNPFILSTLISPEKKNPKSLKFLKIKDAISPPFNLIFIFILSYQSWYVSFSITRLLLIWHDILPFHLVFRPHSNISQSDNL